MSKSLNKGTGWLLGVAGVAALASLPFLGNAYLTTIGFTMLIAYMITGETTFALKIGGLDTIIKFAAYFGHERAWLRISYGKIDVPDYQI